MIRPIDLERTNQSKTFIVNNSNDLLLNEDDIKYDITNNDYILDNDYILYTSQTTEIINKFSEKKLLSTVNSENKKLLFNDFNENEMKYNIKNNDYILQNDYIFSSESLSIKPIEVDFNSPLSSPLLSPLSTPTNDSCIFDKNKLLSPSSTKTTTTFLSSFSTKKRTRNEYEYENNINSSSLSATKKVKINTISNKSKTSASPTTFNADKNTKKFISPSSSSSSYITGIFNKNVLKKISNSSSSLSTTTTTTTTTNKRTRNEFEKNNKNLLLSLPPPKKQKIVIKINTNKNKSKPNKQSIDIIFKQIKQREDLNNKEWLKYYQLNTNSNKLNGLNHRKYILLVIITKIECLKNTNKFNQTSIKIIMNDFIDELRKSIYEKQKEAKKLYQQPIKQKMLLIEIESLKNEKKSYKSLKKELECDIKNKYDEKKWYILSENKKINDIQLEKMKKDINKITQSIKYKNLQIPYYLNPNMYLFDDCYFNDNINNTTVNIGKQFLNGKEYQINFGYRKNCLLYTNKPRGQKPNKGLCQRCDCKKPLGKYTGVSCTNKDCFWLKCFDEDTNHKELLFHDECLIWFENGLKKYCTWCVFLMYINQHKINENEYFCKFLLNVDYSPCAVFMEGNIRYILLKGILQNKDIIYTLSAFKNTINELVLTPNDDISEYIKKHDIREKRQQLIDKNYICINNKIIQVSNDYINTSKCTQIKIKIVQHNDYAKNLIQVKNFYPKFLQKLNIKMALDELYDIETDKIKKEIEDEDLPNKWCNAFKTFGILFNKYNYKVNITQYKKKHGNIKKNDAFKIGECVNTYHESKWNYLYNEMIKFVNNELNELISLISKEISYFAHWNDVKIKFNGMTEQLLYKQHCTRHIDTHFLFKPYYDNSLNDGTFIIMQNCVDAEFIKKRNGKIKVVDGDGTKKKIFCIYNNATTRGPCNGDGETYNEHFEMDTGDILICAKDAAFSLPHAIENTDGGWCNCTMARNYIDEDDLPIMSTKNLCCINN